MTYQEIEQKHATGGIQAHSINKEIYPYSPQPKFDGSYVIYNLIGEAQSYAEKLGYTFHKGSISFGGTKHMSADCAFYAAKILNEDYWQRNV